MPSRVILETVKVVFLSRSPADRFTEQGTHAAGGAYDYLVDGHMFGGFALVAHPADYGNTGVMTFLVNHDGVLYEKDLGPETAELAAAMKVYDPDDAWRMVSPEERNQLKLLEQ